MCKKTNYKIPNPRIDKCMKTFIRYLKMHLRELKPVACCCGHSKYPMTIVCKIKGGFPVDLVSGTIIPRLRKFYKRDKQGYYHIPEVTEQK